MKIKFKNFLLLILIIFLTTSFCLTFISATNANAEIMKDNRVALSDDNCVGYDLVDDEHITLLSLDSGDTCSQYCSKHGEDRKNGGLDLLEKGCRNYFYFGYNYGETDIPFWINMTEVNKLDNDVQKNKFVSDVRTQVDLWNRTYMFDGRRKLVNFYEIISDSKPNDIKGKKVIEVLPYELNSSLGEFSSHDCTVKINCVNGRINCMPDTIVHEFGHVLGLGDMARIKDGKGGVHYNLMSYERITARSEVYKAIHYPDVQGIAVMNGRHTCQNSHFMRYVKVGNEYRHICFYCDRIDNRNSIISGSKPVESSSDCDHDYRMMVSSGVMHWKKCTKCYKVLETEGHREYIHYLDREKHEILCADCDVQLRTEAHNFTFYKPGGSSLFAVALNRRCIDCGYTILSGGAEIIPHEDEKEVI